MLETHSSEEKIGKTKIVYKNHFKVKGDVNKVLEYLKSTKVPDVEGFEKSRFIGNEILNDKSFRRVIRSKLPPVDSVAKHLITFEYVDIQYELAHDDGIITSICRNPLQLQGKFNFTEEVVICQDEEDNEYFTFERKAIVSNKAAKLPFLGSAFNHFNNYYNNQSIQTYLKMFSEC